MQITDVPQATRKLIDRGKQLKQEGKIDKAITNFQQAIADDATAYEAYHFLGEKYHTHTTRLEE